MMENPLSTATPSLMWVISLPSETSHMVKRSTRRFDIHIRKNIVFEVYKKPSLLCKHEIPSHVPQIPDIAICALLLAQVLH